MSFEIDIGFASQAGRKEINEDFCAAMLTEPGQEQPKDRKSSCRERVLMPVEISVGGGAV